MYQDVVWFFQFCFHDSFTVMVFEFIYLSFQICASGPILATPFDYVGVLFTSTCLVRAIFFCMYHRTFVFVFTKVNIIERVEHFVRNFSCLSGI